MQDSIGVLRSIAHHTALGNTLLVNHLHGLAAKHPRFDHAFVFTATIQERKNRLMKRMLEQPSSITNADRLILHDSELFKTMDEVIIENAQRYFNAEVVDTSTMSIEQVQEYVLSKL